MTYEQKQQIIEVSQKLYATFKPVINLINSIIEKVKEIIIKACEWTKSILNTKINTFSRKKKGNRYVINKIRSIPIYKYFMKNKN